MIRDRFLEFQYHSLDFCISLKNRCTQEASPIAQHDVVGCVSPQLAELGISHLTYDTASRSQLFLHHVNELRTTIDQLHRRIQALQQRQYEVLSEAVVSASDKEQLSLLINEIKGGIRSLRPQVRRLEEDLHRDEVDAPVEFRTGAEVRIRRNHCDALKMRLNDLLLLFNKAQLEYKQRVSKRVKRQLDLAGERISAQEVTHMLESASQEIFYRQLNPASYAAKIALEEASKRHNEIVQLEESIHELDEIFRDMHDLVYCQNQLVNHIAKNVELANEFTRRAQVHVHKAVNYRESANRNKCIALSAVLFLLLLFTFVVLLFMAIIPNGMGH